MIQIWKYCDDFLAEDAMSKKDNFNIAVALSAILQAGINVIVPVFIYVIAAKFLINRLAFPDVTMVICIVLGVVTGVYNMFRYIYSISSRKR